MAVEKNLTGDCSIAYKIKKKKANKKWDWKQTHKVKIRLKVAEMPF